MAFKLLWQSGLSKKDADFMVEVAHLIGFRSLSMEFPLLNRDLPDGLCLTVGTGSTCIHRCGFSVYRDKSLISICPNGHYAEAYKWLWENLDDIAGHAMFPKKTEPPEESFPDSTAFQLEPRYDRPYSGLECLFSDGLGLHDTNSDGLPDTTALHIALPESPTYPIMCAACDIACRLGMETTGISYPLTTDSADDGVIYFTGSGSPAITLEPGCRIAISGESPDSFVSGVVSRLPLAREERQLSDCAEHIRDSLCLRNLDGQLAALESSEPAGAVCCCYPKIENMRPQAEARWRETEFISYTELTPVCSKDFTLPWEVDEARRLMQKLLSDISRGDRVNVFCALSEDKSVRDDFAAELRSALELAGAEVGSITVICAYKQGFSWLEEVIVPQLVKTPVKKLQVLFKPFLPPGESDWQDEDGAVPKRMFSGAGGRDKWFDLPLRTLQELFPIDDVIAPLLGISRGDVEFDICESDEDISYLVRAFDADGKLLLEDSYRAAYSERPYLDAFPEMGLVHPSTGFMRVEINGKPALDSQIKTDLESVWDIYQSEVLPCCRDYANARCGGAPRADMQPFFARLRLDITLSEPERRLGVREDMISPLNALHEDIYFTGLDFFNAFGMSTCKERFTSPGLFLPVIHIGKGRPQMSMTLYAQRADRPVITLRDGSTIKEEPRDGVAVIISEIREAYGGPELVFEVRADRELGERAEALVRLCGNGMTEISHLLADYAAVTLRIGSNEFSSLLPEKPELPKDLCIEDIDISENELIGYDRYLDIIHRLKRVPGLSVFHAATTYQGRDIYAIRLLPKLSGCVSRVKLIASRPTELINGRHHANEVSATNAAFIALKALLTEEKYRGTADDINLLFVPLENADGAAIHYELQKEHPYWKFHIARYNSLGKEFAEDYFKRDTIHTEALCLTDIFYRWLPDIHIDNHGVPSHEWEQQFSGYTSPTFKGFWLPRALLYGYFACVSGEEFDLNERLNRRWADAVADALLADSEIQKWNADWRDRFEKYAHKWLPRLFPAEYYKNMINYFIISGIDPRQPHPSKRFPWITSLGYTAEAADETAQGEYLGLCARTHTTHIFAGIDLLRAAGSVCEESLCENRDGFSLKACRLRPVIPRK